jgi:hypothetical protein
MRRTSAVPLLALVACGRLRFDPIEAADGAGSGDSSAPVDAALIVTSTPIAITSDPQDSRYPALSWSGAHFAIAWRDSTASTIQVQLLSPAGAVLHQAQVAATFGGYDIPRSLWTGSEHAVLAEADTGQTRTALARFGDDGVPTAGPVIVANCTGDCNGAAFAWNGNGYGLVWADSTGTTIRFGLRDSAGATLGGVTMIGTGQNPFDRLEVVWTGAEYAVVWVDGRTTPPRIYFDRLDAGGVLQGAEVAVSVAGVPGGSPSLVWTGSGFALVWDESPQNYPQNNTMPCYLTLLDPTGAITYGPAVFDHGYAPRIAWTGSDYAVALTTGADLVVDRIAADGTLLGSAVAATVPNAIGQPTLVAIPGGLAAAWEQSMPVNHDIYVELIGLP